MLHLFLETKPEKPRTMKKIFASLCVLALLFASCNKSEEAWTPLFKGLRNGLLVVEESDRLIGECNYHNASDGVAEIGIKICETDCQNRGVGRKVLSMLISWLFRNGYAKIILDTNLTNTRAQHVYELLGFRKVRTNIDSWKDQFGRLQSSVDYALVEQDFVSYE